MGNVCDKLAHAAFLLKKKPGLGNIRQTHLGPQCSRARAGRKNTGYKRGGFLGVSPPRGGGELNLREIKALVENEAGENKDPPLQSVLQTERDPPLRPPSFRKPGHGRNFSTLPAAHSTRPGFGVVTAGRRIPAGHSGVRKPGER